MAYETEFANLKRSTDEQSAIVGAALVQSANMLPLVASEDLPVTSNKKRFWKDDYLHGAEVLAETTYAVTYAAGHELTQSSVDCTAAKYVSAAKLSLEGDQFTSETPQSMLVRVGDDIARDLDTDIKALADGFSNTITATDGVLTPDDLLMAVFTIEYNTKNVSVGRKIFICNNKAVYQLKKYGLESSAAAFTRPTQATLLEGSVAPVTGLVATGYLGNIDIVQTSGMPTDATTDTNLLFDPMLAIRGIMGPLNPRMDEPRATALYYEVFAWMFAKFVEWYDEAGCEVASSAA